jgi:hypothetical protein
MNMLMGIEMSRVGTQQPAKFLELAAHFGFHGGSVAAIHNFVLRNPNAIAKFPLAKIEMQTNTERRTTSREFDSMFRCELPDHQAGAGYNPVLMRVQNPTINALRSAKIVGIHNQISVRSQEIAHNPARFIKLAITFSVAKYSWASARAARHAAG